MNHVQLMAELRQRGGGNKQNINHVMRLLVDVVGEALERGEEVKVRGLGRFYRRVQKPRRVNVPNGHVIDVDQRGIASFRAAAALRDRVA